LNTRYLSRKVRTKVNSKTELIIYSSFRLRAIERVECEVLDKNDVAGKGDG